jgi:hypothetical protein
MHMQQPTGKNSMLIHYYKILPYRDIQHMSV